MIDFLGVLDRRLYQVELIKGSPESFRDASRSRVGNTSGTPLVINNLFRDERWCRRHEAETGENADFYYRLSIFCNPRFDQMILSGEP